MLVRVKCEDEGVGECEDAGEDEGEGEVESDVSTAFFDPAMINGVES